MVPAFYQTDQKGEPDLDGARLFNAAEALGISPKKITENCDSVMFCISKGLGAPIGSLRWGNKAFISRAVEWRKLLDGTMRQTGVAAACGIYALENNVERLAEDRENAQYLARRLRGLKVLRADPAPQRRSSRLTGLCCRRYLCEQRGRRRKGFITPAMCTIPSSMRAQRPIFTRFMSSWGAFRSTSCSPCAARACAARGISNKAFYLKSV